MKKEGLCGLWRHLNCNHEYLTPAIIFHTLPTSHAFIIVSKCFFLGEKRGKKEFALVQIRTVVGGPDGN